MDEESVTSARKLRDRAGNLARAVSNAEFWWAFLLVGLIPIRLILSSQSTRLDVLRGILLLTAAGEGLAFVSNVFRPRRFSQRCGRRYDPSYHGVMQDFGFYNLAFTAFLALAALDPMRSARVISVVIAAYAVHGVTHVLRYRGIYYGGGTPIPTRPQRLELRDGLQLLAAAMGMALFFS